MPGDCREPLDKDRSQAAIVKMIGDLDRDFRPCVIELNVQGVPTSTPISSWATSPKRPALVSAAR